MNEVIDTVVIGAGQAGLAASYFLTQQDREQVEDRDEDGPLPPQDARARVVVFVTH